tara:strand:+ start:15999 stop:17408 length:1410 start_codon:yes stop_codon:yes gene_type:complete
VGLTLFAWLILQPASRKSIFFTALLFGIGLFGVGVSWIYVSIHDYGEAPMALALTMMTLFVVFLAAIFALPWVLLSSIYQSALGSKTSVQILCFAALWLIVEWIRSWFLTGFPWLYVGQGHLNSPLLGWAPIIGALGIGFLQAGICATLALSLRDRCKSKSLRVTCMLAIILLISSPLLIRIVWTESLEPIQIALVQPNIPLQDKWDPALREVNLQKIIDLSEPHWNADILVWPEAALPLTTLGQDELLVELSEYTGPDTSLLSGRLVYDPFEKRFLNNVIGLGHGSGEYSKRRLVPFGEYVPFEDQLRGIIEFFDLPMSVISRGDAVQEHLQAGELSIAVAVCYEIAYGHQVGIDSQSANLLMTVSSDTWFGNSIGPHQHFQLAQVRALETSKPVIRGTNNGITGLIDHRGRIQARAEQFSATVLTGSLVPQRGMTPFSRWGQNPMAFLSFLILALVYAAGRYGIFKS